MKQILRLPRLVLFSTLIVMSLALSLVAEGLVYLAALCSDYSVDEVMHG